MGIEIDKAISGIFMLIYSSISGFLVCADNFSLTVLTVYHCTIFILFKKMQSLNCEYYPVSLSRFLWKEINGDRNCFDINMINR